MSETSRSSIFRDMMRMKAKERDTENANLVEGRLKQFVRQ